MKRELYYSLTNAKEIYQQIESKKNKVKEYEQKISNLKSEVKQAEKEATNSYHEPYRENEEKARYILNNSISKVPFVVSVLLCVARFVIACILISSADKDASVAGVFSLLAAFFSIYYCWVCFDRPVDVSKVAIGINIFLVFCCFPYITDDSSFDTSKMLGIIGVVINIASIITTATRDKRKKFSRAKTQKILDNAKKLDNEVNKEFMYAHDLDLKEWAVKLQSAQENLSKEEPQLNQIIVQLRDELQTLHAQAYQIIGAKLSLSKVNKLIGYYDAFFVEMRREPNDLDDLLTFVNVKDSQFKAKLEFDAWQNKMEAERRAEEERARIMRDLDATLARNRLSNEIDNLRRDIDKLSR